MTDNVLVNYDGYNIWLRLHDKNMYLTVEQAQVLKDELQDILKTLQPRYVVKLHGFWSFIVDTKTNEISHSFDLLGDAEYYCNEMNEAENETT